MKNNLFPFPVGAKVTVIETSNPNIGKNEVGTIMERKGRPFAAGHYVVRIGGNDWIVKSCNLKISRK